MAMYARAFWVIWGSLRPQVLLTQEDLGIGIAPVCPHHLDEVAGLGTIPIINENDSVSVRELMGHQLGARGA
jgi:glutamate 5-kinase